MKVALITHTYSTFGFIFSDEGKGMKRKIRISKKFHRKFASNSKNDVPMNKIL